MNVHEHQAKELLKQFGVPVPNGVVIYNLNELKDKIKKFSKFNLVLKAQIHAGGRGKAGGIKKINSKNQLLKEAQNMFGKILITPQTGKEG